MTSTTLHSPNTPLAATNRSEKHSSLLVRNGSFPLGMRVPMLMRSELRLCLLATSGRHLMIVFGGVAGLEDVVSNDPDLRSRDTQALFDLYLNVCPNQGSNTIRTEEAMLVTLSALRPMLVRLQR